MAKAKTFAITFSGTVLEDTLNQLKTRIVGRRAQKWEEKLLKAPETEVKVTGRMLKSRTIDVTRRENDDLFIYLTERQETLRPATYKSPRFEQNCQVIYGKLWIRSKNIQDEAE